LKQACKVIKEIIRKLRVGGAEEIVLGCTELPLIVEEQEDIIDSLQILAEETVKYCIGDRKLGDAR